MSEPTKIKVCGLTRAEDAQLCAHLGADFLGFVFAHGSPRAVEAGRAAAIVSTLAPGSRPKIVGVFRDASIEQIRGVMATVPLDFVQLHGSESEDFIAALAVPTVKALRVGDMLPATKTFPTARWLLFDTYDDRRAGGTGKTFDWSLMTIFDRSCPFFLAGGIGPDNVAAAVSLVRPTAVDVSSGVEAAPGIKDEEKLRRFFQRVRRS